VRSRSAGRDDEQVGTAGDHVFANTVGEELLVGIAVFVCPHQPTVLGEIGGKDCRQPSLEPFGHLGILLLPDRDVVTSSFAGHFNK
jgi:hypothetical protein